MVKEAGHEVVRLPPYHCELNRIELAWPQVKRFIKANNTVYRKTFEGENFRIFRGSEPYVKGVFLQNFVATPTELDRSNL